MAEELKAQADALFVEEEFEAALDVYTKAISLAPQNPIFYISRAATHIKLENFTDAVANANKAIEFDPLNPKGFFRKGIACFSLEEYQTAKIAFQASAALDTANASLKTWIRKCDAELQDEAEIDASVKDEAETKETGVPGQAHGDASLTDNILRIQAQERATASPSVDQTPITGVTSAESAPPVPTAPVQPKFRHEWYQSPTQVVVSIFAKGVKAEELQIEFGEQILSVVIHQVGGEPYVLQLRLHGRVKASECTWSLLKTKVEIRMPKSEAIHWLGLDFTSRTDVSQPVVVQKSQVAVAPSYPSSKAKHMDWDKLEASLKNEEKDEKLEGDAALNKLFQDIYKNADEDTRRAMNKSFVESSGTVLSTNWKDVGSKKIEGSPPSGLEMHKYNE